MAIHQASRILRLLFAAAALFCAAAAAGPAGAGEAAPPREPKRLTNPLLKHTRFKELRTFKPEIEAAIERAQKSGGVESVGYYFRTLKDGLWIGIGERENFAPASLLKVPIMMAYYKAAEKDPGLLGRRITYPLETEVDEPGIRLARESVPGRAYTTEQMIAFMIEQSDNGASSALANSIAPSHLVDTFQLFGVDISRADAPDSFVSLKICASFLRVLYNASYLDEKTSERALAHLLRSGFEEGIKAGLPPGVPAAHKFGERFDGQGARQLHDMAIVYHPDTPYLLAVMTRGRGGDYSRLEEVIKELSAITWREVESQSKKKNDAVFSE